MLKPKVLLVPGEDTPAGKPPLVSTEDQTQERVYVSENMAMQGDSVESDVTEQNSEGYLKILDKIQAKSSSIFEFSLQFDDVVASLEKKEERLRVVEMKEKEIGLLEESISRRLSVLEEKEIETDLRLVIEASIMRLVLEKQREETSRPQLVEAESRKRSNLEIEPPLLVKNDSDADSCTPQAKKQKSQEANDGDIEGIVCTDKSYEDPNSLTCPDTKLNDFSKSMSSFAVDQVWALYDPRDDMPRNYAQIREIFESQLSLQVTLLEHVKTTKDEQSILSGCGRFEYGDTEIKSHLMFAHEMDHIKSAEEVIVNPRKGETWALFSDWNASWNSHLELQELPYRYDFVEVISEFDDLIGIQVAYMGRVEGYESVFNHAEQYGCIKIVIPPAEMQRFSHKVESVKLSGKEEEGIPFRSFKLNPAAMPRYYHVLEEVVETEIQIKDPTVVHQNGSTKDLPIIID